MGAESSGGARRGVVILVSTVAVAVVALVVGGILWAALTEGDRDESGRISNAGSISVFDVRVGDCVNGVEDLEESLTVDAVPCSEPHDAETYATFDLPESDWPGQKLVFADGERGCDRRFPDEAGDAELFFLHPTEETWTTRDDRTIACMAVFKPRRSGSLR